MPPTGQGFTLIRLSTEKNIGRAGKPESWSCFMESANRSTMRCSLNKTARALFAENLRNAKAGGLVWITATKLVKYVASSVLNVTSVLGLSMMTQQRSCVLCDI